MNNLLIASRNNGKIKEIKEILRGIPFEIKSLIDIGLDIAVKETGITFAENATLKAKTVGEKTGLLTLADDSGLEVDILGGKPGIHSARYTKETDLDRINKLLKELKNVAKDKRTARFKAAVAIYIPSGHPESRFDRDEGSRSPVVNSNGILRFAQNDKRGKIFTFVGISKGYITEKPIGTNGFGYDPIFFNPDLGKTNAEVSLEEKNRVSHRAKALMEAKEFLLSPF